MKNMKMSAAVLAVATITGCATASKDVATAYVSPMQYNHYDCQQLGAEAQRINLHANQLAGRLDQAADNDKAITGVALVLFWPALFALGGTKEQEAEYARMKGEHDAIQHASISKKCDMAMINPAPLPKPEEPVQSQN